MGAESLCYFKDVQLILPIAVSLNGFSTAEMKYVLSADPSMHGRGDA
jgi:hypothetical protein